tara:strand:+ start:818 stop:1012 length:195 start_codon:yes stop_codon:yes gene_type:complete
MKLKESYLILIFNLVQKEVYSKEVFQLIPRKLLKELYKDLKIEMRNLYELADEEMLSKMEDLKQ